MIFDFNFKNLLATESGGNVWLLLAVGFVIVLVIGGISLASGSYENRLPSHADGASAIPGLGHHL